MIVVLMLLAGICTVLFPFVMQWRSEQRLRQTSGIVASYVAGWPHWKIDDNLERSRAYNRRILMHAQPVIGESANPFVPQQRKEQMGVSLFAADEDSEYWSLIDAGEGIMGTVRIPKIDVVLPIYHGTSTTSLNSGVGHLYGTSLPVGGASTHTVITGHRGLASALMFTRLDEMAEGDVFHLDVLNETLSYRVDSIRVIEPDDVSSLLIRPDEDRVTLMTCTPYGINTQRLLVSGIRTDVPASASVSRATISSRWLVAIGVGLVLIAAIACCIALRWRRHGVRARHAKV